MSDSMTNLEMQDVLSSIRRLVSQKKDVKKEGTMAHEDRFVLTPAHRVAVPEVESVPEFLPDLQPETETDSPLELAGLAIPEAEPEQAATSDLDAPPETAQVDGTSGTANTDTAGEDDALPPLGAAKRAASTLEMRIAELEVAVDRTGDEWEPDGSEPDADQGPDRHIFEVVDNTHFFQPGENSQDPSEEPLQLADVAVFTHFPGKSEAPAESTPTEQAKEEVAEQAVISDDPIRAVPASTAPEPEAERFPAEVVNNNDDVFVDEDILRRVVAEVVSEELQGKLGERITRNVRRMVRREIEQTLSLKEFD